MERKDWKNGFFVFVASSVAIGGVKKAPSTSLQIDKMSEKSLSRRRSLNSTVTAAAEFLPVMQECSNSNFPSKKTRNRLE